MNSTRLNPLAEDYLARLDAEARVLPDQDRQDLVTELRGHLEAGLSEDPSDAEVRNLLQDLGSPGDIVAAAALESGAGATQPSTSQVLSAPPPPNPWGTVEIIAVLGLTAGVVVIPLIGPVIGLCFVWASVQWTSREKAVASVLTLLPAIALALGGIVVLMSGPGGAVFGIGPVELLVLTVTMLGPLVAAGYLVSRLNQRRREGQPTVNP